MAANGRRAREIGLGWRDQAWILYCRLHAAFIDCFDVDQ
jgi:hypothetical protein